MRIAPISQEMIFELRDGTRFRVAEVLLAVVAQTAC